MTTPTVYRVPTKSPGQLAYEDDLSRWPTYSDGRPRPAWDALSFTARCTWELRPMPRSALPTA